MESTCRFVTSQNENVHSCSLKANTKMVCIIVQFEYIFRMNEGETWKNVLNIKLNRHRRRGIIRKEECERLVARQPT
jgi:hypothetical protein